MCCDWLVGSTRVNGALQLLQHLLVEEAWLHAWSDLQQ